MTGFDWRSASFDAENRYMEVKRDLLAVIQQRDDLMKEIDLIVKDRDLLAALAIGFMNNIFIRDNEIIDLNKEKVANLVKSVQEYLYGVFDEDAFEPDEETRETPRVHTKWADIMPESLVVGEPLLSDNPVSDNNENLIISYSNKLREIAIDVNDWVLDAADEIDLLHKELEAWRKAAFDVASQIDPENNKTIVYKAYNKVVVNETE